MTEQRPPWWERPPAVLILAPLIITVQLMACILVFGGVVWLIEQIF